MQQSRGGFSGVNKCVNTAIYDSNQIYIYNVTVKWQIW
jgi:hypothetical protein